MKKYTIFAVALFAAILLLSCGGAPTKPGGGNNDMIPDSRMVGMEVDPSTLVSYKDMVCGMSVKNIPIADTAHYNGRVYPFCAKACKELFVADPGKYAAN